MIQERQLRALMTTEGARLDSAIQEDGTVRLRVWIKESPKVVRLIEIQPDEIQGWKAIGERFGDLTIARTRKGAIIIGSSERVKEFEKVLVEAIPRIEK